MNAIENLECHDCGALIRKLTPTEARQLAANPLYTFAVNCNKHRENK